MAINGLFENRAPPPSTFAAQIVDNIESASDQPNQTSSRAHLRELLHRVLEADRQGSSSEGAFDSSLEVNHKLICVVVKACLLNLPSVDPFDGQNEFQEQARDSLAVIELTIRRNPDVLFASLTGDGTHPKQECPLFLWLVPHLLNLLTYKNDNTICAGVRTALQTALSIERRPSTLRLKLHPVLDLLRNCVDGPYCRYSFGT